MVEMDLFVVMGPSGCGKSTLGQWLANELKTVFLEGDSFHPEENISKMSQSEFLTKKKDIFRFDFQPLFFFLRQTFH